MAKENLATMDLKHNAADLLAFIDSHWFTAPRAWPTVYVTDEAGRVFNTVSLIRETLSDGSHVLNLVLSPHQRADSGV